MTDPKRLMKIAEKELEAETFEEKLFLYAYSSAKEGQLLRDTILTLEENYPETANDYEHVLAGYSLGQVKFENAIYNGKYH